MFDSLIRKFLSFFQGQVEKKISNIVFSKNISVDKIPSTTEEFIEFRDRMSTTPEGGVVSFLVACLMYNQNPQLGRECIIIQTDASQLQPSNSGYKGYDLTASNSNLVAQLSNKSYIVNSYVQGTSNQNGYALPNLPYTFSIERTEATDGGKFMKVFIRSTGADASRPIRMGKNDKGIWKAMEYSSLFVGVNPPISTGAKGGDF